MIQMYKSFAAHFNLSFFFEKLNQNDWRVLFAMLIGHKNPETGEFYTPNVEPYTEYKLSSRINYNNEILGRELVRRHRLQGIPGYHQLNRKRWVTEELISTHIANPIKDEEHLNYIIKKEKEVREII